MPAGVGRHAVLEAHRIGQPRGIDHEQHQVAAAREEPPARAGAPARAWRGARTRPTPATAAAPRRRSRAARQAAGSMRCTKTSGATLRSCLHGGSTTGAGSRRELPRLRAEAAAAARRRCTRNSPPPSPTTTPILDFLAGPADGPGSSRCCCSARCAFLDGPPDRSAGAARARSGTTATGSARRCSPRSTQTNEPARCAALVTALGRHRGPARTGRGRVVGRRSASTPTATATSSTAGRLGAAQRRPPGHGHDRARSRCPTGCREVAARVGIDQNPLDAGRSRTTGRGCGPDLARAERRTPGSTGSTPRPASPPREPATVLTGDLIERLPEALALLPAGCHARRVPHRGARLPGAGAPGGVRRRW